MAVTLADLTRAIPSVLRKLWRKKQSEKDSHEQRREDAIESLALILKSLRLLSQACDETKALAEMAIKERKIKP